MSILSAKKSIWRFGDIWYYCPWVCGYILEISSKSVFFFFIQLLLISIHIFSIVQVDLILNNKYGIAKAEQNMTIVTYNCNGPLSWLLIGYSTGPTLKQWGVTVPYNTGLVFTKGLSEGLGLNLQYYFRTFKPKPWLSSFWNTGPGQLWCKFL